MNGKRTQWSGALASLLTLTALSANSWAVEPQPSPSHHSPTEGLKGCVDFQWMKVEGVSDRAAISIPIQVNGVALRAQLDTGANTSILYGNQPESRGWAKKGAPSFRAGLRVGGATWARRTFQINREMGGGELGGTIGLDVFIGKLGVLDYPARRFCLLEPTDPAAVSLEAAHWQAATLRNGKLFLPVSLGEHTKVDAFFDTGSSVFPMFVDTPLWKELTGIDDPTTATTTITGSAWGKPVAIHGSPTSKPLKIGDLSLGTPVVFTNPQDPTSLAAFPFPVSGLFGNAPFWDHVVVIDLTPEVRFGILE